MAIPKGFTGVCSQRALDRENIACDGAVCAQRSEPIGAEKRKIARKSKGVIVHGELRRGMVEYLAHFAALWRCNRSNVLILVRFYAISDNGGA